MLVTRLLSSSHAPQWRGSAWIASTNTSTDSFSRSSFRSTTPYLFTHTHTGSLWAVHYRPLRNRVGTLEERLSQVQGEAVQLSRSVLLTELHPQLSQGFVAHLTLLQRTWRHEEQHTRLVWRVTQILPVQCKCSPCSPKLSTVSSSFFFSPDLKR